MMTVLFFSKTVRQTSWLQPRSPAAKPLSDIAAAELVAASFLGLCFDDDFHGVFLNDSAANFMAAAQEPCSNKIRVVAFNVPQLTQASFLQKIQMLQNAFLTSVMLTWHRASVASKNQSF